MFTKLWNAILLASCLYSTSGMADSSEPAPPSEPPREIHQLCAELISAIELNGTDPNLIMLLRVFNERVRRLENSAYPNTVTATPPLSLPEVIRNFGLPAVKTEILTGRLRYGEDEYQPHFIRDTTGAMYRLEWLLESFKTGSKKTKGAVSQAIANGMLAWMVNAENEKVFSSEDLKRYIGETALKRKTFEGVTRFIRVPSDLDGEVTALMVRMDMTSKGSFQTLFAGMIHLICDAFEIPDAVLDDDSEKK